MRIPFTVIFRWISETSTKMTPILSPITSIHVRFETINKENIPLFTGCYNLSSTSQANHLIVISLILYLLLLFFIIMCADGPAVILDFDEELQWGLSIHNRIMYRRRKTKNLLRAWIFFQEHIINNDVVQHAVQNNGYEP